MSTAEEEELRELMSEYYADPYGWVMFAYPWGEKGTELENKKGPEPWQERLLKSLGRQIKERGFDGFHPVDPILEARVSGHGVGKSAMAAWLTQFVMSTREFCKGTITANTGLQLRNKTFAAIQKWHDLLINKHWFDISPGGLRYWAKGYKDKWFFQGQSCKEENSEAFAGQHETDSSSVYICDEASGISDKIEEVMMGGLTDGEPMVFAFGNGTRSTGWFKKCFNPGSKWNTESIDSREVSFTNKKLLNEWVEEHGEDSDFVRVRIRGMFPLASSTGFYDSGLIDAAMQKEVEDAALVGLRRTLSCDVARFGDDLTVISERWGHRMKVLNTYQGKDLMWTAGKLADHMNTGVYDEMIVDDTGLGGGVTDRLRQLGFEVTAVNAGEAAQDPAKWYLIRTEMAGGFLQWLKDGGSIPNTPQIKEELESIEYYYRDNQAKALVSKKVHKALHKFSPDTHDSFALHFAHQSSKIKKKRKRPLKFRSEF